jgi:hypothetical protein
VVYGRPTHGATCPPTERENKVLIKVNAENDTNGNPRRGWIHLSGEGRFLGFYPEGYDDGGQTLREIRKGEAEAYPSINITPKEYKRLKGLVA